MPEKEVVMVDLYWNIFFRGLGVAILSVFTPVYIFLIGSADGGLVGGVRMVIYYIIAERLTMFLLSIPVSKAIEKIGFGKGVLIGSMLLFLFCVLPVVYKGGAWLVILMGLISAPATLFYWTPRNSLISIDGVNLKMGKEFGLMGLLDRGASVLAPLIGGLILATFGFHVLYAVGAIVILFSCLPLLKIKQTVPRDRVSWKGFARWLINKDNWYFGIVFAGTGMESYLSSYFWPIYIYIVVGSFKVLGGMVTLTTLLSMLALYYAGRLYDNKKWKKVSKEKKLFWGGGIVLGIIEMSRVLLFGIWGLFLNDLFLKLVYPIWLIPYESYLFMAGKRISPVKFFTYREMIYELGQVSVAMLVLFISIFEWRWWVIFGMSGLGLWMSLPIAKEADYKP